MIDPRLLADIKQAEGCRLVAYKDTLGNWTAGVGHLLPQDQDWAGVAFSQAVVDDWLTTDLEERMKQAWLTPEWQFLDTPCRCNAVVEIIFNLGEAHWLKEFPGTRAAIRQQKWQAAHDNLLDSPLWVKQVGLKRVSRLANYLLYGAYP